MELETRAPANWAMKISSFNAYASQDLFGGAKIIKLAWAINAHKLLTPLVVLVLMLAYEKLGFTLPSTVLTVSAG